MQHKRGLLNFSAILWPHALASLKSHKKVHVGLEAQIHKGNKNTKPQEIEIHSQGHKTLMYQTKMHARPKVQIHRDKKNTKP
jgi:hypothetical protein